MPGTTRQQLAKLFSTAGSLRSPSTAFDPALSMALAEWLGLMVEVDELGKQEGLLFAAAAAQIHLFEAAGGDAQLAALLLGSGACEEEFLRCVHPSSHRSLAWPWFRPLAKCPFEERPVLACLCNATSSCS
jgi:hypothetical protein